MLDSKTTQVKPLKTQPIKSLGYLLKFQSANPFVGVAPPESDRATIADEIAAFLTNFAIAFAPQVQVSATSELE